MTTNLYKALSKLISLKRNHDFRTRDAGNERALRVESLETREMLSITPIEYAAIVETYEQLNLPAEYADVNVIELAKLTAQDLQNAVREAEQTNRHDVILINTDRFDDATISLRDATITLNANAQESVAVTILATGSKRLQIVANDADATFRIEQGTLQLANLDVRDAPSVERFVELSFQATLDAITPSFNVQNVDVFDVNGGELTDYFAYETHVAQAIDKVDEYFCSNAEAYSENDYAVIFSGGQSASVNSYCYYLEVVELYKTLTTQLHLNPKNIFILYADGDTTKTSRNRLNSAGSATTTSDMTFATQYGTSIKSATKSNLTSTLATVADKMNANSHLLFYVTDHGGDYSRTTGQSNNGKSSAQGEEYVIGWGTDYYQSYIYGSEIRDALYQVKQGYVTTLFNFCNSGGILDKIFDPTTGRVKNYNGAAHFAGGASSNHYELSISGEHAGYGYAFTNALTVCQTTREAFEQAKGHILTEYLEFAPADKEYANDEGAYYAFQKNGQDFTTMHPWHAGEDFNIFNASASLTADAYEPNNSPYTAYDLGYLVGARSLTNLSLEAGLERAPDYYKFTLPANWKSTDKITTLLTATSANRQKLEFAIYDADAQKYDGFTTPPGTTVTHPYTYNGTLRTFTAGKSYYLVVRRLGSDGEVGAAIPYSLTITGSNTSAKLAKPTVTYNATSDSITFSWNKDTNAASYEVVFNNGATQTLSKSVQTKTYTGLKASTSYTFKIRAIASGTKYGSSDWITITAKTQAKSNNETPSTIVTTASDVVNATDGLISLREAIGYASSGGTVTFSSILKGKTLTLNSELVVDKSVTIDGGANKITLSGGGEVRVLYLKGGSLDDYFVKNLTIVNGCDVRGAGLYVANGTANIVNCSIVGNTASTAGGGLYVAGKGIATLTNTLVAQNSAQYGGGVYSYGGVIADPSYGGNSVSPYGLAGKAVVLTNCTITNNMATVSGSGLHLETGDGAVAIRNSIIAQNAGVSDVYKKTSSRVVDAYNTLSPYTKWTTSASNPTYVANMPLFENATQSDYSLAQGSQAVNQGNDEYVLETTDLANKTRIVGAAVDLGAYELQLAYETPSTIVTTTADVVDPTDQLISLREAVKYAQDGGVVTFAPNLVGGTITLREELLVEKSVAIAGEGNNITLSGSGRTRALRFLGAATDEYTLSNLTIADGNATHGAGIYVAAGKLNLANCSIVENASSTSGGGIYVAGAGALSAVNVLIANNSAKYGGGLYAYGGSGKSVTLTNCTIASNTASSSGSGLHMESGNGTVEIRNSIIALNTGASDVGKKTSTRVAIANNTLSTYTAWSSGSSANLVYSPNAPLFTNAGQRIYTLAQGSQAINKGDNSYVSTAYDLANGKRIVGAKVDLGAYELQLADETPSTIVTTTADVVDPTDELISLREAINYANTNDTITFAASLAGQTITLDSELLIEKPITLDGGANHVTLSGGGATRVMRFLMANAGESTVRNVTITNGSHTHGAGVYVAAGTLNLVNCSVTDNNSTTSGGGVYVAGAGALNATNVLIAKNTAKYGGGLYTYGASGNKVVLTNCTIAGNRATSSGSGLHLESGAGVVEIRNSIIAQNVGVSDVGKKTSSRVVNAYNTLSSYTGWTNGVSALRYDSSQALFAPSNISAYTLAAGSSAINAGNNNYVSTQTDLAGGARIVGSAVDLGAYEAAVMEEEPSCVVTTALDVVDKTDGYISLREAIAYATSGDVVTFTPNLWGRVITLSSELLIDKSVVIDGELNNITVSGGDRVRVMRFLGDDADEYAVKNLKIANGASTHGAGVYVATGTVELTNCAIVGNTSTTSGGGIYVAGKGGLKATNALIVENSAKYGGGIYSYGGVGKSVVLTNCTIANNKATVSGAGLHLETENGRFELRNSIVAENRGVADVYKKTSARVLNAYNTMSSYSDWSNGRNNLAYSATWSVFMSVAQGDYTLVPNSSAINAGNNSYNDTRSDLSNSMRIIDSKIDLGAYERQVTWTTSLLDEAFAELFDESLEIF